MVSCRYSAIAEVVGCELTRTTSSKREGKKSVPSVSLAMLPRLGIGGEYVWIDRVWDPVDKFGS